MNHLYEVVKNEVKQSRTEARWQLGDDNNIGENFKNQHKRSGRTKGEGMEIKGEKINSIWFFYQVCDNDEKILPSETGLVMVSFVTWEVTHFWREKYSL